MAEIFPAIVLIDDKTAQEFKPFAKKAYEDYFSSVIKKYNSVTKLRKATKELSSLGNIIYSYALVADKIDEKNPLLTLMLATPLTSLSVQTVPAFISLLIALDDFTLIEKYIKAAGVREVSEGTVFKDSLKGLGEMFSVSALVSQNDEINSKYAGGNVTPYGFYILSGSGEEAVLGNIWEDLPKILVDEGGAKGIKVINNIFYNNLQYSMSKKMILKARWESGVLIPFIIGSLDTNKIEGRAVKNNEAIRKYYKANQAGVVELDLMSYKMYDLNNPTYRRVREVITEPYWSQIAEEEKYRAAFDEYYAGKLSSRPEPSRYNPPRNNFNIYKSTSFESIWYNGNMFNGMVYNPKTQLSNGKTGKTGLILREADSVRNSKKALWGSILKYTNIVDIGISLVFLYQLATAVGSLAVKVSEMVKLVKAARGLGVKSFNVFAIVRGIHKRPQLRLALNKRIVRADRLLKAEKAAAKAAAKHQAKPTRVTEAKVQVAEADVNAVKAQNALERKIDYLDANPQIKAAVEKDIAVNNARANLYNNRVATYNEGVTAYNKAVANGTLGKQKVSANSLQQTGDFLRFNTYKGPTYGSQTTSYIETYKSYQEAMAKAEKARKALKSIRSERPAWQDPFKVFRETPSVNLLGEKAPANGYAPTQAEIEAANLRVDARNAQLNSPEGQAALAKRNTRIDRRNRRYDFIDKYTFGIGGKTLKALHNNATHQAATLLLAYSLNTSPAIASSTPTRIVTPINKIELVDPTKVSFFHSNPFSRVKLVTPKTFTSTKALPATKAAPVISEIVPVVKPVLTPTFAPKTVAGVNTAARAGYVATFDFAGALNRTQTPLPMVADAGKLPTGWELTNPVPFASTNKLIAEVGQPEMWFNINQGNNLNVGQTDPLITAGLLTPLFLRLNVFKNKLVKKSDEEGSLSNKIKGYKANSVAKKVLNTTNPLITELRDIVNSAADNNLKKDALLRMYNMGAFASYIKSLAPAQRQLIQDIKQQIDDANNPDLKAIYTERLKSLLFAHYTTNALAPTLDAISNNIPINIWAEALDNIISTPEFKAESNIMLEDTPVLSAESNIFTGVFNSIEDVNKDLILNAIRDNGWAESSASEGKTAKDGWFFYENDVPVYYRSSEGEISNTPVIVLHQEKTSLYSSILAALGLSTKKGFKVPKGMILAIDENGKFKYMVKPGHLEEVKADPEASKVLSEIYKKGSYPVIVDTPFAPADLLAIAELLEISPLNFQIDLNRPSSFDLFLKLYGFFYGMNVDNTMVGPFKDAAKVSENLFVRSNAGNLFGGVGYATPRSAAETLEPMKKFGIDKSVFTIFTITTVMLGLSSLLGINGFNDNIGLLTLALPMVAIVMISSLLRSVQSLVTNHYRDPQKRTSINLDISSYQQGSKLVVSLLTFALPLLPGINEFIVIPFAALASLVALLLFMNTHMWDNVKESIVQSFETAELRKAIPAKLWEGTKIAASSLAKGTAAGVFAPFIAIANFINDKFIHKPPQYTNDNEGRYAKLYDENFLPLDDTKAAVARVTLAYASYAASIMFLNQISKTLLGDYGQLAVAGYAAASLTVRKLASKWVGKGKFTDDQLTGISFIGLAAFPLILALIEFAAVAEIFPAWITTTAIIATGIGLNMSTAVPGQLDNIRLQNSVTAVVQDLRNKVNKDPALTEAEKTEQIKDLNEMEKTWAERAATTYARANGNGIYGIYAAVIITSLLSLVWPELSSIVPAAIFIYSGLVATVGAYKTIDMAKSFLRAVFGKEKGTQITEKDIVNNTVTPKTFGIDEKDVKKAKVKMVEMWKGKKESIDALQKTLNPYGGVPMASEVKMTKVLKRMIQIHNRLVAYSQVLGKEEVSLAFADLFKLAKDFDTIRAQVDLSNSLNSQFDTFFAALCENGDISSGVMEQNPSYIPEGNFQQPKGYENFMLAKDIISEMRILSANIRAGGNRVNEKTYSLFVSYLKESEKLLKEYLALNPAEESIVKEIRKELRGICNGLKISDTRSNTLIKNAGPTSMKDVQALKEALQSL